MRFIGAKSRLLAAGYFLGLALAVTSMAAVLFVLAISCLTTGHNIRMLVHVSALLRLEAIRRTSKFVLL